MWAVVVVLCWSVVLWCCVCCRAVHTYTQATVANYENELAMRELDEAQLQQTIAKNTVGPGHTIGVGATQPMAGSTAMARYGESACVCVCCVGVVCWCCVLCCVLCVVLRQSCVSHSKSFLKFSSSSYAMAASSSRFCVV